MPRGGMRAEKSHVHWMAPTSMLIALVTGTLLALGHHLFYQQLNGQQTPTDDYRLGSLRYSRQQMNIQIGTAFAFLVKAFLVFSISIAHAQVFWSSLSGSHRGRLPNLSRVDTAFSALSNITALLNLPVWLWNPVLLSLATLTCWLLPIASIIAPGTLSIRAVTLTQSSSLPVPYLNFSSLSFTDRFFNSGDGNVISYDYNGPSQAVENIAAAVSAQGVIMDIAPPSLNSSWQLEFYGPTLKCGNLDDVGRERIFVNVGNYFAQPLGPQGNQNPICTDGRCAYLSWFQDLPFTNQSTTNYHRVNETFSNTTTTYSFTNSTAKFNGGNATISFATFPGMFKVDNPCQDFPSSPGVNASAMTGNNTVAAKNPLGTFGEGAAMVQCQFFNSSYKVDFQYINGKQNITIDAPGRSSDTPFTTFSFVGQKNTNSTDPAWGVGGTCLAFQPNDSSALFPDPCGYDPAILRAIAYQGVMEAFANLFVGSVRIPYRGPLLKSTEILSTALLHTAELGFLDEEKGDYLDGFANGEDLQQALEIAGVYVGGFAQAGNSTESLGDALEEMFRNYTISLMSSERLRPSISKQDVPLANVTTIVYRNIYAYSSNKLWLAYGIAILLTALAVSQGLFNYSRMGTWNAKLSVDSRQMSDGYQDPLPDFLAKATLELPSTTQSSRLHSDGPKNDNKSDTRGVYANVASVSNNTNG